MYPVTNISRNIDGVAVTASYYTSDGVIYVTSDLGKKVVRIDGSDVASLASFLLSELYQEFKARQKDA